MEKLYQSFKEVCEFRLVYIKEAHAADSNRSVRYAKELGITEHKNYDERCSTAGKLLKDKSLTMPFLIDDMENSVNKAYSAFPDRIFIVRADGRLAVAAERGPRGFAPALRSAGKWLSEFRRNGEEPRLPKTAAEPGKQKHVTKEIVETNEDLASEKSAAD